MAYTPMVECNVETNVIRALPDEPISPEYTASEFKAAFDQAPEGIKSYINATMVAYINALARTVDSWEQQSLPDNAVTTPKINANAVTSSKVADGTIVRAEQLGANVVTSPKIADLAVTTEKISNSAVKAGKLALNAVITNKIANSAVTLAKLATTAIPVTAFSGNFPCARLEGELASSLVPDGFIDDIAKLGSNCLIDSVHIGTSVINSTHLANSIISSAKLATNSIYAAKIKAGQITSNKFSANAVRDTFISEFYDSGYTTPFRVKSANWGTADPTGTPENGTLYFKIASS